MAERVKPPLELAWEDWGAWRPLPGPDAVCAYLARAVWQRPSTPSAWEIAQLSTAVFAYRERERGQTAVAKFYSRKSHWHSETYAAREMERIQAVTARTKPTGVRVARALGVWRSVLLLEYAPGQTLQAFVGQRPFPADEVAGLLDKIAAFLAHLHQTRQPNPPPDPGGPPLYARKLLHTLAQHGVLRPRPAVREQLEALVDNWAGRPDLFDAAPALLHGDMTTGNFLITPTGEIVVIDLERSHYGDPARDVGFFAAELDHSLPVAHADRLAAHFLAAYDRMTRPNADATLAQRLRFYRGIATLRIARNGWLSEAERGALTARARAHFACPTDPHGARTPD